MVAHLHSVDKKFMVPNSANKSLHTNNFLFHREFFSIQRGWIVWFWIVKMVTLKNIHPGTKISGQVQLRTLQFNILPLPPVDFPFLLWFPSYPAGAFPIFQMKKPGRKSGRTAPVGRFLVFVPNFHFPEIIRCRLKFFSFVNDMSCPVTFYYSRIEGIANIFIQFFLRTSHK